MGRTLKEALESIPSYQREERNRKALASRQKLAANAPGSGPVPLSEILGRINPASLVPEWDPKASAAATAEAVKETSPKEGGLLGVLNKLVSNEIVSGALDVLDTPRAALVAGVDQAVNLATGQGVDVGEFVSDVRNNVGAGEIFDREMRDLGMDPESTNIWVRRLVGFAGDVALDPLTYLTLGTAEAAERGTMGLARLAAKAGEHDIVEKLIRQGGRTALNAEDFRRLAVAAEVENLAGGARLTIGRFRPTRKVISAVTGGRRTQLSLRLGSEATATKISQALGTPLRAFERVRMGGLTRRLFNGKIMSGDRAAIREMLRSGSKEEISAAILALDASNEGRLIRLRAFGEQQRKLHELHAKADALGLDGRTIRDALEGNAEARARVGEELFAELDAWRRGLVERGNELAGHTWLRGREYWTPKLKSDEFAEYLDAVRTGKPRKGFNLVDFEKRAKIRVGEDPFDVGYVIRPPEETGLSIQEQAYQMLVEKFGEDNAFELWSDDFWAAADAHVNAWARRVGEERTAALLKEYGVGDDLFRFAVDPKDIDELNKLSKGRARLRQLSLQRRRAEARVRAAEEKLTEASELVDEFRQGRRAIDEEIGVKRRSRRKALKQAIRARREAQQVLKDTAAELDGLARNVDKWERAINQSKAAIAKERRHLDELLAARAQAVADSELHFKLDFAKARDRASRFTKEAMRAERKVAQLDAAIAAEEAKLFRAARAAAPDPEELRRAELAAERTSEALGAVRVRIDDAVDNRSIDVVLGPTAPRWLRDLAAAQPNGTFRMPYDTWRRALLEHPQLSKLPFLHERDLGAVRTALADQVETLRRLKRAARENLESLRYEQDLAQGKFTDKVLKRFRSLEDEREQVLAEYNKLLAENPDAADAWLRGQVLPEIHDGFLAVETADGELRDVFHHPMQEQVLDLSVDPTLRAASPNAWAQDLFPVRARTSRAASLQDAEQELVVKLRASSPSLYRGEGTEPMERLWRDMAEIGIQSGAVQPVDVLQAMERAGLEGDPNAIAQRVALGASLDDAVEEALARGEVVDARMAAASKGKAVPRTQEASRDLLREMMSPGGMSAEGRSRMVRSFRERLAADGFDSVAVQLGNELEVMPLDPRQVHLVPKDEATRAALEAAVSGDLTIQEQRWLSRYRPRHGRVAHISTDKQLEKVNTKVLRQVADPEEVIKAHDGVMAALARRVEDSAQARLELLEKEFSPMIDASQKRVAEYERLLQRHEDRLAAARTELVEAKAAGDAKAQKRLAEELRWRERAEFFRREEFRLSLGYQGYEDAEKAALAEVTRLESEYAMAVADLTKLEKRMLGAEEAFRRLAGDVNDAARSRRFGTRIEKATRDGWVRLGANTQAPEWVVEGIKDIDRVLNDPEWAKKLLAGFDAFTHSFKAWAVGTPGFHFRNFFGGLFNNALAEVEHGLYKPFGKAYWAYERAILKGASVEEAAARAAKTLPGRLAKKYGRENVEKAFRDLAEAGVFTGGQAAGELRHVVSGHTNLNPFSPDFKPLAASRRAGSHVENILRGTLAFDRLLKGRTMADAIGDVFKYHFDYDDLSAFERSVARRVIPFYTWTRRNFPLQIEMMLSNPRAYNRFTAVKRNMEMGTEEQALTPQYFLEQLNIRTPFSGLLGSVGQVYVIPDLPFRELTRTIDPRQLMAAANPLVKLPAEQLAGKPFFTDVPFRDTYRPVPKVWFVFGVAQAAEAMGIARRNAKGELVMRDRYAYAVDQVFPAFARARRLAPSEDKYSSRWGTTMLNFMFGLGVRTVTPAEQAGERYRRNVEEFKRNAQVRSLNR